MTWAKLLARNVVTALPATKGEIDDLRSIVARSLSDVAATGLSVDARFMMAYDAARTLSLIVVRAAGYRPKVAGFHHNIFVALETPTPRLPPCRRILTGAASSAMRLNILLRAE